MEENAKTDEDVKAEKDVKVGEGVAGRSDAKRYYVDFYDMIDGWGSFGFFTERLSDSLLGAIDICDKLNSELDSPNKDCGEHYGVIDDITGREVYCGMDKKYKEKISDIGTVLADQITNITK